MNPDLVRSTLFVPLDTHANLGIVLDAFEKNEWLRPTYWSFDERQRLPYDRGAILASPIRHDLMLWGKSAPEYVCMIERTPIYLNRVLFTAAKALTPTNTHRLYGAMEDIVASFGVEYGIIYESWNDFRGRDKQYARGADLKRRDFYHNGPRALGARTWFGRLLVDRIGRSRFAELPNVAPIRDDGLRVDLVEQPWSAEYAALLEGHNRAYAALSPSGMFADGSTIPPRPGPAWTKPDWKMTVDK